MSEWTVQGSDFDEAERALLREHQLAVFQGRLIHQARPPIDRTMLARVTEQCAGPLPPDLVDLWREAFGGLTDYGVRSLYQGRPVHCSCSELFFPESAGYRDLWGWMERQLDYEANHMKGHDGRLHWLPFGGLEYPNRLFVEVVEGPTYGSVIAYVQGFGDQLGVWPEADAQVHVAGSIREFFTLLSLESEPLNDDGNLHSHIMDELLGESLEPLAAAAPTLYRKVLDALGTTVVDWRAALEDGSIASDWRARDLAWEHVVRHDDIGLLESMIACGCNPTEPLCGPDGLLARALSRKTDSRVAQALLSKGDMLVDQPFERR